MDTIKVYGIPNCDVMKKTLDWFKKNDTPIVFHDFKTKGITKEKLLKWSKRKSWEVLLNKRSTTWRSLSTGEQEKITNEAAAIQLMIANNSIIKRPVIEYGNELIVGFNEEAFNKQLK